MQEVSIIFGRFNPPHVGHVAAWKLAAQSPIWYVGTNKNTIGPDDPLPFEIKQQVVHSLYPAIEGHFVAEQNWLSMAHAIYEKYGDVHLKLVTDEDWVPALINQYNGREGKHGSYKFSKIEHVVPERLSSATAVRDAVKNNDRQAFADATGVPANFETAGMPYFDLVAKYLLPYQEDVVESNELTVQFHNQLNPALWADNKMRPEVREKLLKIAENFKQFLGVDMDNLHDITVSGSNAAFNYNDGSDIDLHLVTNIPKLDKDDVYRKLFDAQKYQYNATHDYKIRGYDVELYVQDADQPHYSSGIYSIQNDEWIVEPKPSQTGYDPAATADKYQHLKQLFELALKSENLKLAEKLKATMKKYRAAGLKETGEFGPENLAFKALRSNGYIEKLFNLIASLQDKELSLENKLTETMLDNAHYVDQMLIKYANWPGGANKYIIKKAERLDEIIKLLKVTAYLPEIRIFGSANRTDDSMPERIQIYIDANRIQLGKEIAKQALDSIAAIINHYKGMLQAFVQFGNKLYTYKNGNWSKTTEQVSKDGMPLTLFDRSFKQIAYSGLAEGVKLDEVSMSPASLTKFAATPAAKNMKVGFEFEMIVPNLAAWEDSDRAGWREEDWDYDRPINGFSFDDIWAELENFYTNSSFDEIKEAYNKGTGLIDDEIEKLLDENVAANPDKFKSFKYPSKEYNQAVRDFKTALIDNAFPELLETALNSLDLGLMSGWTKLGLKWPHYYEDEDEDDDTVSHEEFSSLIGKVVGNEVVVLGEYHGEKKEPYYWYLEPDSSIEPDSNNYVGAELVSPTMTLNVGMSTLDKFFAFASQFGIESNKSTGLHINLSSNNHFMDELDPLKLILFLGDEYVLSQFERQANEYCKSSMERIQRSAKQYGALQKGLDIIRQGINQIALKNLQQLLVQTNDKYVSVHIKKTHVEFRSAGGDYFSQKELIKNTLLRYAQAFALALDPAAEKNEYLKKIYKTLTKSNPKETAVSLFAQHYIGFISTNELKDKLRDLQQTTNKLP